MTGSEADTHAGEQTRPHVDCDGTELGDLDVGLVTQELDRGSVSVSACRRPRDTSNMSSTPSCPPMARLTCWVAVSIPSINVWVRPTHERWEDGRGRSELNTGRTGLLMNGHTVSEQSM